jgi:hypothetical protein
MNIRNLLCIYCAYDCCYGYWLLKSIVWRVCVLRFVFLSFLPYCRLRLCFIFVPFVSSLIYLCSANVMTADVVFLTENGCIEDQFCRHAGYQL